MKTIKQIADELGVSKQKVYRFIVRNHITASSEVKQSSLWAVSVSVWVCLSFWEQARCLSSTQTIMQTR